MKIIFIPVDNRPISYNFPLSLVGGNFVELPNRELLGGLTKSADIEGILKWLENLSDVDVIVVALDTIAYGGLVQSRRSKDSYSEILKRINKFRDIAKKKKAKVYAFSSIMRISNNNYNEEEKEYWNVYGKKIYQYSYNIHKYGDYSINNIPEEIIDDYIETRLRNLKINCKYVDWNKKRFFETLVFAKDDCGEYGFNVFEGEILKHLGSTVITGTDEIPMLLLAKALDKKINIAPIFLENNYLDSISNYEDVSIEKSVKSEIELAGCNITDTCSADVLLYVNNFIEKQGDIVMKVPTKPYSGTWKKSDVPYMIADVRFANGADNDFVKQLFENGFDKNFVGYAGWNTSANTLGSLILLAKISLLYGGDYKKVFAVRLLDDWAYQANVRQMLTSPDVEKLKELMKPFEEKVFEFLKTKYKVNYKFPWNRLFEVEVELS